MACCMFFALIAVLSAVIRRQGSLSLFSTIMVLCTGMVGVVCSMFMGVRSECLAMSVADCIPIWSVWRAWDQIVMG